MTTPDIASCHCGSGLDPDIREDSNNAFSFGVWVECPTCRHASPRTWICFEQADCELELVAAQTEAIRAWNRIQAAVTTLNHLTTYASEVPA